MKYLKSLVAATAFTALTINVMAQSAETVMGVKWENGAYSRLSMWCANNGCNSKTLAQDIYKQMTSSGHYMFVVKEVTTKEHIACVSRGNSGTTIKIDLISRELIWNGC